MLIVHTRHPRTPAKSRESAPHALTDVPFESAAAVVLGRMQEAFINLLRAMPGPTGKTTDIEKTCGIDAKLSWQVFRIATATNPLAVGTNVPARVSVERLLKAAARRGVPADVIERVGESFSEFERFIQENAEDREGLEAMIAAHLPEAREKAELASKQAAFRAMSQIRGIAVDAAIQTYFRSPAQDGDSVEMVSLEAYLGLRRMAPEAKIGFYNSTVGQPDVSMLTLEGERLKEPGGMLLPQFSSSPLPRIESERVGDATHHWIAGRDVGLRGAVDLVSAWRDGGRGRRYWHPGEPTRTGAVCAIESPVKRVTLDVFVHRDLYVPAVPETQIHLMGMHGHIRFFGDPSREADRLDMRETVRSLGTGLGGTRLANVPAYVDMLEQVYARLGWRSEEFRGYRLDVQYPIHGAQYSMGFELPPEPR